MTTRSGGTREFRGDIQGLRAIAVLAVVLYHAHMPGVRGGFVGVDVFFVVSGFLITGQLIKELTVTGRIDFSAFYTRRARRILPAALAVIVLTVAAAVALQPPVLVVGTLREAAAAALYVPNLLLAYDKRNYFSETAPSPLQHYWSLGVEEQFYLLWPLAILLAFRILGRSQRGLLAALALTTALSLMLSVYLTPKNDLWAFFGLPTRVWEFGFGGLLAVAVSASPRLIDARAVGLLGWFGIALILGAIYEFDSQTAWPSWLAAIPVLGTALVIFGCTGSSQLSPRALLSLPPLLFIGLISYSMYLVHQPLLVIAQEAVGLDHRLPGKATLALGLAAIPLGWLVYHYIERPCRGARLRNGRGKDPALIIAVTVSVVLAAAASAAIPVLRNRPLDGGITATASALERYPRGTSVVPSNLEPSLWDVGKDNEPGIVAQGCHASRGESVPKPCSTGDNPRAPTVALLGDSHAANFYPAFAKLARAGDIRLRTMTKGDCQTVATTSEKAECTHWRERVLSILNDDPPDIMVLGNHSFKLRGWEQSLRASLDRLPKQSRTVVIADTPTMASTPAICLSAHLRSADACDRPRDAALNRANREAERKLGLKVLDVTDFMCNPDYCPPIIGNLLVYRDSGHLTEPFSQALAPVVRAQLLS